MSKILFIKANDRPADQAVSVQMYDAFYNAYKEANPADQIVELDLYAANLPAYGNDAATGTFKVAKGIETTPAEQEAADLAAFYQKQFFEADKVVVAFPLWNFTVPAPLVNYISYLSQAGVTFKYTAEGPVGLAGDKKVALLNARGGVYSEGPAAASELAVKYVSSAFGFWGIQDLEVHIIEGHNAFPDRAAQIVQDGLRSVAEAAARF
ncbi:FMN-dependent NADH-azoreductase [Paenibacillus sp. Marseille-Q4541]|uniref:FMN-dependent NADH-azoreductase n=1 Tax=Paenibacillus sp. Marseille-Q4541 TaxID=2831522 RepID=UPI001BAA7A23|nr:FMN-dependent NADH-azoreductase [Paenibacillus sp. Marseille-Q4541]